MLYFLGICSFHTNLELIGIKFMIVLFFKSTFPFLCIIFICASLFILIKPCQVCVYSVRLSKQTNNYFSSSFPSGTTEGSEEKKKKVPAMTETRKKERRNFTELKMKHLRKKVTQDMFPKAKRKLIYEKKLSIITRNIGRSTD